MADHIVPLNRFAGGIAGSEKEGMRGSFFFGKRLDIFSDPARISILPETAKVSAAIVTDLVKWIVSGTPHDTNLWSYSEGGKIYKATTGGSGTWTSERTVANSDGQGLEVHDDYLYYVQQTQVGRYGPLSGSPTFTDAWQTGLTSTATTKFAPIKKFLNGLAIGHANKLAWWDGSTFTAAKLTFPAGFNVRTLDVVDEFLAIGAWKGTTVQDAEVGMVFFWDGSATSYNFFVEIPDGTVNATWVSRNRLFGIIGSTGILVQIYPSFNTLHRIPKLTYAKYLEVFPGAASLWRGIAHIGVAANTDSTAIIQGIYQYGSKDANSPDALNYAHTVSTTTETGTTLKIGAVEGVGDELYFSWRDGSSYGVDRVIVSADPYATGVLETLIFDNDLPVKDKAIKVFKATHLPLASGESVQLGHKLNRATSYTTGTANSTADSTDTRLTPATTGKFKEIQWEVVLGATGTTSPTVTSAAMQYDSLEEERGI